MNMVREQDLQQILSKIPYEKCEGKTFLISGANGFLARYMADTLMYLKKKGYVQKCTVIALCRNRRKAERVFEEWLTDEDFHLMIQPVEKKIDYAGNIDYLIHAASSSQTNIAQLYPVDIMEANIIGSYNMLELAREKKVESFLFFSSGAAYGDVDEYELREDKTYNMDYLNMKNSYAVGKRTGEALCRAYWQQYLVPAKGVRIGHTYGPGIDLEDGHVYSDFAKSIIEYKDLIIKGDGTACRPFCYVSDAVCAFFLILLKGQNGEIYNMVNPKMNVSIKELADLLVERVFPDRGLRVVVKKPATGKSVQKLHVSTTKLGNLDWDPKIDLDEGFRRLVRSEELEQKLGS